DARAPLREGLDVARRCGGARTAARAHDELTASGVNQRRMLRAGVEALTPSERRIARMAADGMSNRDIAAALFVTVRTVETHLGHAYRKLDLRGRAGLAQALG
ncbi:MAG TPA: helix-turn-helix transcriptional regulator, partial [Solirubrobacteraceae bacterium]